MGSPKTEVIIKTVKLYPGSGTILGEPNIESIFQVLNNKYTGN